MAGVSTSTSTSVSSSTTDNKTDSDSKQLYRISYEVHGKVQGVYFRKYTKLQAEKLGLTGWVQNTAQGTVVGEAEGTQPPLSQFKTWLANTGSPASRIEKCEIHSEIAIESHKFTKFKVVQSAPGTAD